MVARAFIAGCEGTTVSSDEAAFLRDADPWGIVLFGRNVETPGQVRALTSALRDALGREAPIFIDQEGGRVQRFRPPHWHGFPAAARFGQLYARDPEMAFQAVLLSHHLMALELSEAGVDCACAPVVDVPQADADPVIGDRAFARAAQDVGALALAALDGLSLGGCLGVIKHIPGHGRATADSHTALPVVDTPLDELTQTDFAAFQTVASAPMAMTAHVVYSAVDDGQSATTSRTVIHDVIRTLIGFDGLLMCDDLSMNALSGDLKQRTRDALAAGCDVVLHGNGMLHGERLAGGEALRAELECVAAHVPELSGKPLARANAALAQRRTGVALDVSSAHDELEELLRSVAQNSV